MARSQIPTLQLRKFIVRTITQHADGVIHEDHEIVAHFGFDNTRDGGTLVFRRYLPGDVKTEKVAEFQGGTWVFYKEVPNGQQD